MTIKYIQKAFVIFLMVTVLAPSILANPSFPISNTGNTSIPNESPEDNFLMDPNITELHFTSEYVYLKIIPQTFSRGDFNATYIITNSGTNWINQTIALPGYSWYAILGDVVTSILVDDASVNYWVDSVIIENQIPSYTDEYYCFLFNVTFAPLQSRTISVEFPFTIDRYTIGNLSVEYIVTTGNSWSGSIGLADIIFEFPSEYVSEFISIIPIDCTFSNVSDSTTKLQWHYENWNPTEEIRVIWAPDMPIEVYIEYDDIKCNINEEILVNATIINNGATISSVQSYQLQYDFGDGYCTSWISNLTASHKYNGTGTYQIKIWVRYTGYYLEVVSEEPATISVTVGEKVNDNSSILIGGLIILGISVFILILYVLRKNRPPIIQ